MRKQDTQKTRNTANKRDPPLNCNELGLETYILTNFLSSAELRKLAGRKFLKF